MLCAHCGTENDDRATTCTGCGCSLRDGDREAPPSTPPPGQASVWHQGTPVGQGGDTWTSTPPSAPPPPPPGDPARAAGWTPPAPPPPYPPPPPGGFAYPQPPFAYGPRAAPAATVPDYLVQAIILTFFSLCTCVGIPSGALAIVFAAQARAKAAVDHEGALESARNARVACSVTLVLIFVGLAVNLAFGALSGLRRGL